MIKNEVANVLTDDDVKDTVLDFFISGNGSNFFARNQTWLILTKSNSCSTCPLAFTFPGTAFSLNPCIFHVLYILLNVSSLLVINLIQCKTFVVPTKNTPLSRVLSSNQVIQTKNNTECTVAALNNAPGVSDSLCNLNHYWRLQPPENGWNQSYWI